MSESIQGPGFLVQVSPHGAHTWTTITEPKDISGPEQTMGSTEVSNQQSGRYREYKPTMIDGGNLTFPCNWVPEDASQLGLLTDLKAGSVMDWQLVMADSGRSQFFEGFVTKWGTTEPFADTAMLNVEVKITGEVTEGATEGGS